MNAASVLYDLKTATKGRSLFKRNKYDEIIKRRKEIIDDQPSMSQVGAFQMALRELWEKADQEYWERKGSDSSDFVFECALFSYATGQISHGCPEIRSFSLNICSRVYVAYAKLER